TDAAGHYAQPGLERRILNARALPNTSSNGFWGSRCPGRRSCKSLIRQPGGRSNGDGEEIWRGIRGWTLQADAPSLRFVDKAVTWKIAGNWAASRARPGRNAAVDRRGSPLERRRLGGSG